MFSGRIGSLAYLKTGLFLEMASLKKIPVKVSSKKICSKRTKPNTVMNIAFSIIMYRDNKFI
ncbi:hypothetical protein COI75_19305 [Bacillus cereus]|nr:hypothetical protein CON38_03720 [Bacillus cereus]PFI17976.1 hypothetical protein COI75_19305 [Bacillus cereus]